MAPPHTADKPGDSAHAKVTFADGEAASLLHGRVEQLYRPDPAVFEPVKDNASRTVYRGSLDGQDIYLKHFHSRSILHRLAGRLGLSDAQRELAFSKYLLANGIATVQALAVARRNGFEWLATRAVAPSVPADVWHRQQLSRGRSGQVAIQQALLASAEMIGRLHAAGVIHLDLHCGNILIRTDTPTPQPVLSDLHRICRRRRLSRRARAANLALLYHDRCNLTTRSERLRFLRRYLEVSGAPGTLRSWSDMVEDFARQHTQGQLRQRDRRIFGRNRYFTDITLGNHWRGHVVLASKRHLGGSQAAEVVFERADWQTALADPDSLFTGPDVQVVKDSPSSQIVRRTLTVGEHTVDVFIKRSRRKQPWKILLDCFRQARPIRAFELGHALLTRGIATALPLAAMERRIGPLLLDSLLITEAVDAPPLNTFIQTYLADGEMARRSDITPVQQRQLFKQVLWQMGRILQRLHDNNFAHRDLKANNVLVRWLPPQRCEVVLVDLDGLRPMRHLSQQWRFQGLMRLNVSLLECPAVSNAGRLRMLLGYLRRPGSGRVHFKAHWRALEDWSARKLRRQIRSRRRRQRAVRRT